MKEVKIGGVPEHFNLPWNIAIEEGLFEKENIALTWQDFPAGTGALCDALRSGEIDLAVILTEGIVKDISAGNPSKIVQVYVQSPLLWGIHVAADADYQTLESLQGTKAAISRFGSGSHLMAIVNAEKQGWNLEEDLHFSLVEDLQGALQALPKGDADYFMWEKFMTKPFVDDGTFRLIDETPTPWPGFVIVAREDFIASERNILETILRIINSKTANFKNEKEIDKLIATRFDQQQEDVQTWLSLTTWSQKQLSEEELNTVLNTLFSLELIETKKDPKTFLADI